MTIETGFEIPPWDMPSVSPDRMKTMAAILRDPYPVHWDPRVVEQIGLGKRTINQGPLGLSYMINMLHDWTGIGSIKRLRMTFPLPVLKRPNRRLNTLGIDAWKRKRSFGIGGMNQRHRTPGFGLPFSAQGDLNRLRRALGIEQR